MGVIYTKTDQSSNVSTGTGVPTHSAVAGDRYTNLSNGNTYQYTTSWQQVAYGAGGLTYFTEAQATTGVNATVYVDSITAVSTTTNADFAIQPKGTGAILAQIPDGTANGGDKRGQYAVDFQRVRSYTGGYVASGNYSFISGGAFNKATNDYASVVGGYFNISSGGNSISGGYQNTASNTACVSFGYANTASGSYALALGMSNSATNTGSTVFGGYNVSNGFYSTALGYGSNTFGISGRYCYSSLGSYSSGDAQKSTLILKKSTADATPIALSVDNGGANTINQLVLQNNNVFRVKGSITGKQSGSTNVGVWDIDCVIVRGVNAASTVIAGTPTVSLVVNTGGFGIPTLTANTTLGCLTVTVIGVAATNIQWTCAIDTCETIYA
jgi:hypothetical protein